MKKSKVRNSDRNLTPEQHYVAREKGTEPPFTGKYFDCHESGVYRCVVCGSELFQSDAKFDSGTGWPSFYDPASSDVVEMVEDSSHGMRRTEVRCKKCQAHLGHVFDDGPKEKSGKRFCINSCVLNLEKSLENE